MVDAWPVPGDRSSFSPLLRDEVAGTPGVLTPEVNLWSADTGEDGIDTRRQILSFGAEAQMAEDGGGIDGTAAAVASSHATDIEDELLVGSGDVATKRHGVGGAEETGAVPHDLDREFRDHIGDDAVADVPARQAGYVDVAGVANEVDLDQHAVVDDGGRGRQGVVVFTYHRYLTGLGWVKERSVIFYNKYTKKSILSICYYAIMISILAPSKTMDFTTELPYRVATTTPLFITGATEIATTLKRLKISEIEKKMKVSRTIATNVQIMYEAWNSKGQKPALWTYVGDVYKGMKANKLDEKSAEWAQQHIVTMSGLYGIVRPYDLIAPYRLEMKAVIPVGKHKNIYSFWGEKLATYVSTQADGIVCNLSSDEYGKPVTSHLPKDIRIVTPVFYDNRPSGKVGRAPIYNKMMRGVMARWIIDHRVDTPEGLRAFTGHGYAYSEKLSTKDAPAFFREEMKPLVF